MGEMFSWGEDRGPWSRDTAQEDAGVHLYNLSYHIRDLCAGHSVLAFVKTDGNAFIIRTNESKDGRRVRGKQSECHFLFLCLLLTLHPLLNKLWQNASVLFALMLLTNQTTKRCTHYFLLCLAPTEFVKCEEKIQAVSCGDDLVTLLSDTGTVFCVDTARAPFTPR